MRLQTYLARAGAAPSRRKGEAMISAGHVTVNGATATLGANVSSTDEVLLDGRPVKLPEAATYLALHKPAGYLTTLKDEPGRDRRTINDLMPPVPGLVPVGRLDAATTGLILLTNDGPMAHRIMHPSSEIEKAYSVTVKSPAPDSALAALAAGPELEDGKMLPSRLTGLRRGPRQTTFELTIHEGRNRIIRRACAAVGLDLISLHRTRIGPVRLGNLPEGQHRPLTSSELEALK
ncbi:MAG TPA: pseudouridine synthase [Rubrobacteraceae bacterium]|nr:pseudouridine synthase [Rubrobacteraceae bacterium]